MRPDPQVPLVRALEESWGAAALGTCRGSRLHRTTHANRAGPSPPPGVPGEEATTGRQRRRPSTSTARTWSILCETPTSRQAGSGGGGVFGRLRGRTALVDPYRPHRRTRGVPHPRDGDTGTDTVTAWSAADKLMGTAAATTPAASSQNHQPAPSRTRDGRCPELASRPGDGSSSHRCPVDACPPSRESAQAPQVAAAHSSGDGRRGTAATRAPAPVGHGSVQDADVPCPPRFGAANEVSWHARLPNSARRPREQPTEGAEYAPAPRPAGPRAIAGNSASTHAAPIWAALGPTLHRNRRELRSSECSKTSIGYFLRFG
ncbi:hypothetical protein M2163_006918 [Streptomyces sp. SAI-135]|nr:hypothetical protein [Streptomyces sp. SAI-090]MDH6619810.1 hypothetical protein [Streptomyces sp. SAI-135]